MEKAGMTRVDIEKDALTVDGVVFDRLWYKYPS